MADQQGLTRKLAAIVYADVAGYSLLTGMDEEGTHRTVAEYLDVISNLISAHGGRVVHYAGDAILAEFPSVVASVKCAVAVQKELAGRNDDLADDRKVQFRIGVNLGDVIVDRNDIYGNGVNVAARLESLADPGGICVSGSVFEQVHGKVDVSFEDIGAQEVKNIEKLVQAYRVMIGNRTVEISSPSMPSKPSIAVLPFENRTNDAEQEFLADGITEDVITGLSKFRSLFVIARSSCFSFKERRADVREIAKELGVRYVLEGTLRGQGNRIRVSGHLIDATRGTHIWADRFDGFQKDLFELQDQVTKAIVRAIEPEISKAELNRASRRQPDSLDAWGLYQKALNSYYATREEKLLEAVELFDRATDLDPRFAPGFAMAADARTRLALHFQSDNASELLGEASQKAAQALELDAQDPVCLLADGRVKTMRHQYDQAIPQLEQSIALNPNYAMAYYSLGFALHLFGKSARAIEQVDMAVRLSPHDLFMSGFCTVKSTCFLQLGQYEEALAAAQKAIRSPNPRYWAYGSLAAALAGVGRLEEARGVASELMNLKPNFLEHLEALSYPGLDVYRKLFRDIIEVE